MKETYVLLCIYIFITAGYILFWTISFDRGRPMFEHKHVGWSNLCDIMVLQKTGVCNHKKYFRCLLMSDDSRDQTPHTQSES